MSQPFIILLMLFCHVIADYPLQGILSSMKTKQWWSIQAEKENWSKAKRDRCKYDYIAALVMHSLSWSFMIMLPIAYLFSFSPPVSFFVVFAANTVIHAVVDHLKVNAEKISLVTDQTVHIIQIGITAYTMLRLI